MNRRHLGFVLAHLAFIALAVAYVWACHVIGMAAAA